MPKSGYVSAVAPRLRPASAFFDICRRQKSACPLYLHNRFIPCQRIRRFGRRCNLWLKRLRRLIELEFYERLKRTPSLPGDQLTLATQQLATMLDNLQFLGMGEAQIEELGRTRREAVDFNLTAPADD